MGIPRQHPAGRGIGHQIMIEEGYVQPGGYCVASDSRSNTYGALVVLLLGVGPAVAGDPNAAFEGRRLFSPTANCATDPTARAPVHWRPIWG